MTDEPEVQGGDTPETPVPEADNEVSTPHKVRRKPKRKKIEPPARPPRSNPRGRKAKHNWDLVYREYVEGVQVGESEDDRQFFNYRELSDRHSIPYPTLRERASKERWQERKNQYSMEVTVERQKARSKRLATSAAGFDDKAFKVAEAGLNLVMVRLMEVMQESAKSKSRRDEALSRLEAGLDVDPKDLRSPVYYREMNELASAAERWQNIGMKALGTDIQRHEVTGDAGVVNIGGTVNISKEITRDDPERVAAVLTSLADAGLLPAEMIEALIGDEEIVDAEVVEGEPPVEDQKQIEAPVEVPDAD